MAKREMKYSSSKKFVENHKLYLKDDRRTLVIECLVRNTKREMDINKFYSFEKYLCDCGQGIVSPDIARLVITTKQP